jgi:hypothetical protein
MTPSSSEDCRVAAYLNIKLNRIAKGRASLAFAKRLA